MIYSIPYLLLTVFYGIMALWYSKTESSTTKLWNILSCALVTLLFWGFRGFCFYDWMSYYPMFLNSSLANLPSNITGVEPGFCLLMTLCKEMYDNYNFFAAVCTTINIALLSRFLLKHTDNYPLAMMVCMVFGGILLFTDLIRNAIAIFVFINAIDYLYERKPLKYFLLVMVSISFHYSAVLYIPLYFLGNKKISKSIFSIVLLAGTAIYALNISVFTNLSTVLLGFVNSDLEGKVRYYLEEIADNAPGLNFVFFEQVLTGLLVIGYMDKLRALRKDANIYINSVLMFLVMSFFLHEFVTLSTRMSILFSFGYWVIWLDLLKCFTFSSNRKLFILFVCAYCFLRVLGHTRNALADYHNVLLDPETYQQRQAMFNKYFNP